ALAKTLNEIVRRHETLRTVFCTVEENPMQVIFPTLTLDLPVIDLSNLPDDKRESEVRRLYVQEAESPFNLLKGPLLRATLLWLGEQEHVLLLTMHHIISDAWSLGIFAKEITVIYEAF